MQIAKVQISNILGIKALGFDAGKFVAITGRNGSGKTSALEAIRAALRGGHDATLLRAGAEVGEAVLVLDDGTEIKKRVTESGTKLTISKDGMTAARPADTIKALTDMLCINPVDFLRASKRDRAAVLLESMPIQLDESKARAIVGDALPAQGDALTRLDAARKAVYDQRTGLNRAAKEKSATAAQLSASLPVIASDLPSIDSIQAEISQAELAWSDENERIEKKRSSLVLDHNLAMDKASAQLEEIRISKDKDIAGIERAYQAAAEQINARAAEASREAASIDSKAEAAKAKARQAMVETTSPLKTRIKEVQNAREQAARSAQARETAEQMAKQAAILEAQAEAATKALADLDAYKVSLLSALPIPGLTVVDGEIMRDGVPFDRLNSAQQVEIAVSVAKLRAGKIGVICVDGLELLDSAHFAEFRRQAEASGMQLIVTRVTDGDLVVESAQ